MWKHCGAPWQRPWESHPPPLLPTPGTGCVSAAGQQRTGALIINLILERNSASTAFAQPVTADPEGHTYRWSHGKPRKEKELWFLSVQTSPECNIEVCSYVTSRVHVMANLPPVLGTGCFRALTPRHAHGCYSHGVV